MTDPGVDVLIESLEQGWNHRWESLVEILRGVDEDEARWSPPGYEAPDGDGLPPGSVQWHLNHLADCKRVYVERIRQTIDPTHVFLDQLLFPAATFAEELARREPRVHDALVLRLRARERSLAR